MKVKIAVISIFVIIAASIGLSAWQSGAIPTAKAESTHSIDGVEYDYAVISMGYNKITVIVQGLEYSQSNGRGYYVITDDAGNMYRAESSNVLLAQKYIGTSSAFDRE